MSADTPTSLTLADLGVLAKAIDRDQQLPQARRRENDAAWAGPVLSADRRAEVQLQRWAGRMAEQEAEVAALARRADAAQRLVGGLAAALGLALGVLAALAVFYYDGRSRINVLAVLAVFVLLPLILLVPLVIAMLPARAAAALPGVTPLAELFRGLSIGRALRAIARVLPGSLKQGLDGLGGGAARHRTLYAQVEKWALLAWSQAFALALSLGALATVMGLVVFTDLAFGWSTTLEITPEDFYGVVHALALPWAWSGYAAPTLELVEASRYFRLEGSTPPPEDAGRLGAWWSFILLAMACYGLLPRVVAYAVCRARRRAAIGAAMRATPGASAVLRRLASQRVHTESPEAEARGDAPAPPVPPGSGATAQVVITWAEAPSDDGAGERLAAGGGASVAADRAVLEALAARDPKPTVAVRVKAWEPPMLEVLDFLRGLRAALGDTVDITVVPVGRASAAQYEAWPRKLAALGDPWLRVAEAATI